MLHEYRQLFVYIKANHIYKDMAENIETRFDTWIYELERPLPKGENKKVTGLILLIQWSIEIPPFGNLHKIFASYQTAGGLHSLQNALQEL